MKEPMNTLGKTPSNTLSNSSSKTLNNTSNIYVFLGGTRSGKSICAENKATAIAEGAVLYVATAQAPANTFEKDDAMQQRIRKHQQRRPAHWHTLECPLSLASTLRPWLQEHHEKSEKLTVLVDCITLWVSNVLLTLLKTDADTIPPETLQIFEATLQAEIAELIQLSQDYSARWIFVSGETGLGGVGTSALQRAFDDGLGLANQLLVAQSREAYLVVAGRTLQL